MNKEKFLKLIILFAFSSILIACSYNAIEPASSLNNTVIIGEKESSSSISTETSEPNDLEIINPVYPTNGKYEIITLLPFDAIRSIDNPEFLSSKAADSEYAPNELVIGVSINGESKAYSINLLSRHEIVNDTVGSAEISVTW